MREIKPKRYDLQWSAEDCLAKVRNDVYKERDLWFKNGGL